jgi:hypothetical protein
MRFFRRKSAVSTGRRHRQVPDPAQSSSSFAYRSRRSEEEINTGRQLSRETTASKHLGRFLLKRFGLVVLLIALFLSMVNVLSLSNNARVMSLNDDNANSFLHDQAVYESAASKLLAGSVWNRNKITVNTSAVNQEMLKQFPELSSVSVTLPLLSKRPIVYVQTAQPALILSASNGPFIIDTTGKALLPAGKLPSGSKLKLPVVTDQSGLNVSLNKQALTSGNVSFIQTVIAQLAGRGITVESMVLPVGTSELDVKPAGKPYTVKFNLESGTARQQAGTFLATQSKLQSQNITPAQYIDVRVDGRAYYK